MKSKTIFDSEDFLIDTVNGIPIITINIPRVTFKEADEFKQIIKSLTTSNHNNIIVDFSDCLYADSMIIGIMVETVKTVRKKNGDILVVTPANSIKIMFARTGLFKIFKQFWTKEEAIKSFSHL